MVLKDFLKLLHNCDSLPVAAGGITFYAPLLFGPLCVTVLFFCFNSAAYGKGIYQNTEYHY